MLFFYKCLSLYFCTRARCSNSDGFVIRNHLPRLFFETRILFLHRTNKMKIYKMRSFRSRSLRQETSKIRFEQQSFFPFLFPGEP